MKFLESKLSREEEIKSKEYQGIIVEERFIEEDFGIFGQAQKEQMGNKYEEYNSRYNEIKSQITLPDLIVYLQADPETLINRIEGRGREGEDAINLAYLTELHGRYEDFIKGQTCPVLTIDANDEKSLDSYLVKTYNSINDQLNKLLKEKAA